MYNTCLIIEAIEQKMKHKMKNLWLILLIGLSLSLANCSKDDEPEQEETDRFELLTGAVWLSDSLTINGQDASGEGQMLNKFKGEVKFNKDGSGNFGTYKGTWRFADNTRKQLVIESDSLPIPLTTQIAELTAKSLKVTTEFPDLFGTGAMKIRMTFKAK